MKSKAVRRIELISIILLIASLLAIALGLCTTGKGIIYLLAGKTNGASAEETGENITLIAEGLVLIIHYYFVSRFFITALKEGVPVTHEASKELRILGWETIVLPLLVLLLRVFLFNGIRPLNEIVEIEIYETILGIFIIQTSYVIEYATTKIESGHRFHVMCEKLKIRDPKLFDEIYKEADDMINKNERK